MTDDLLLAMAQDVANLRVAGTWVAVFAALFCLDFVWAKYTFAMTSRQPWRAASYASVIIFLSGGAAVGYTQNPVVLIPAMAGAFAGTFVAVRVQ